MARQQKEAEARRGIPSGPSGKAHAGEDFKAKLNLAGSVFGVKPPIGIKKEASHTSEDDDESEVGETLPMVHLLGAPDKAGFLEKKGGTMFNPVWKPRYLILKGDELYWLKTKDVS